MEYFDIVLALARVALQGDEPRATQQIQRLHARLAKSEREQAAKLQRLLSRNARRETMAPLAVEDMRVRAAAARRRLPGEPLSPNTPVPTDRETGTALARVSFPTTGAPQRPILARALAAAIDDLLAEWHHSDDLARLGTRPHMHCLIYGPPGVGKTRLGHYVAHQLSLPCVEARLDGLMSSFLGTTARNIGALFDFANRYQCVLFLDEFDAIAKARDDTHEIGEIKRVVNTLLQSLDARNGNGITLAATNHDHLLDPAVWRRFDVRIEMTRPDSDGRALLLTKFASPIEFTSAELRLLVWLTEGMSGADLEMLVDSGKRFLVLRHGERASATLAARDDQYARFQLLLETLRRQAALNSRLFQSDRATLLQGDLSDLDWALQTAGLTQTERGTALGVSQSAVSRLGKKRNPGPRIER